MQRHNFCVGLAILMVLAADFPADMSARCAAMAAPNKAAKPAEKKAARMASKPAELLKKLALPITLDKGIPANTPLKDALEFFSDHYDFAIVVNRAAFKEQRTKDWDGNAEATLVNLPRLNGVALGSALRLLLAQVPSKGATFLLRNGYLEITTPKRAESQHLLRQKVATAFSEYPLADALQELSDLYGVSVIVDIRAGDMTETAVTATFKNDVSFETAVRLLADMADLKAVVVGDALYVTTQANAKVLEAEQENKKLKDGKVKPRPQQPAKSR